MSKLALLALSVPLAFAMGCGTESASDSNTDPSDVSGNPDNGGTGGGDLGVIESGLVIAQAPEGLKVDFYFGYDLDAPPVCMAASSCEVNVEDYVIEVRVKCPTHLFVAKTVDRKGKDEVEVNWDSPGDWGLAPQGTYATENGTEYEVSTKIEDGVILLYVYGLQDVGVPIEGNKIIYEGNNCGDVSDDLLVINLTCGDPFTLTLVE